MLSTVAHGGFVLLLLLCLVVFLQEFGATPEELFSKFNRVPIAAASLAQGILLDAAVRSLNALVSPHRGRS